LQLNREFTDCIAKEFLPRFNSGEKVRVEDFCKSEYASMIKLDSIVYKTKDLSNLS